MLHHVFSAEYDSLAELLDPEPKRRDEAYTTSSVITLNHYVNSAGSDDLACAGTLYVISFISGFRSLSKQSCVPQQNTPMGD
jgi:hypothetical protein